MRRCAAWARRRISSSRRDFRPPTGISAGRKWTISTMWPLPAAQGKNANNGVTRRVPAGAVYDQGAGSYLDFRYREGRCPAVRPGIRGVTDEVASVADARLVIPIRPGLRSLNVAMAAAMALGGACVRPAPRRRARCGPRRDSELRGQRDIPDLAGRRRACRPCRGVLPFFRLQPLERARTGPRHRHLPVLRYRFVGTDGTLGGRYAQPTNSPTPSNANGPAHANRYVVLTGGEPLLQVDTAFTDALHARGFSIGIETNGTIDPPAGWTGSASARKPAPASWYVEATN